METVPQLRQGIKGISISNSSFNQFVEVTNTPAAESLEDVKITSPRNLLVIEEENENNPVPNPLPKLKNLSSQSRFMSISSGNLFLRTLSSSSNLTCLHLDMEGLLVVDELWSSFFFEIPRLEELVLNKQSISNLMIESLCLHCQDLKRFSLKECICSNNECLLELTSLSFLESLELELVSGGVTSQVILSILRGSSRASLKRLMVSSSEVGFLSNEVRMEVMLVLDSFERLNTVSMVDMRGRKINVIEGIIQSNAIPSIDETKTSRKIFLLVNASHAFRRNQLLDVLGRILFLRGTPWFVAKMYMLSQLLLVENRERWSGNKLTKILDSLINISSQMGRHDKSEVLASNDTTSLIAL